jgi:hypothetical protein
MPRKAIRSILFMAWSFVAGMAPPALPAQTGYGLTQGNQLFSFNLAVPGTLGAPLTISGLQAGEQVVAIDFRPASGHLYGLGSSSRLYIISTTTGAATQVGPSGAFALGGISFGFDFNPTVDRIRVVSDADLNLRLHPGSGSLAAADSNLLYATGDPNQGANPNVVASAYSNNLAGAGSTTLYGIDSNLDVLVIQNPPNGGVLNTVGPLGVDAPGPMGFDIVTSGGVDSAYATLRVGGSTGLYRIDLATGAATLVGSFPVVLSGLAIQSDPSPRLVNISTRAQVLTGNDVMIAGFVITGSARTVAVVATGPSLAAFGIGNPLANPTLTLVRSSDQSIIASNDDWAAAGNAAELQAVGFAPSNAVEAAILVNLPPGAYTAVVQGAGGGTGVAVVAVYEVAGP